MGHCGCRILTLGSNLPGERRPRTRPQYFMSLPAGLEATGETVSLDELADY
jgi:hypothetical protein